MTQRPVACCMLCPRDESAGFIFIQSRYNQVCMSVMPMPPWDVLNIICEERVENSTPPLDQAPIIKDMLLVIFDTPRKDILGLGASKKVDNQLLCWPPSMADEEMQKGCGDSSNGRETFWGWLEVQIARRVRLGNKYRSRERCRIDVNLQG